MSKPIVTFIGAGSAVFAKNIAGDILSRPALAHAEIRLMDINPQRLEESEIIIGKLNQTLGGKATVRPSSSSLRVIWQLSRLPGWRGEAVNSSMLTSSGVAGIKRSAQGG